MPKEKKKSKFGTLLKWVGSITAILSFIFAVYQLIQLIGGIQDQKRQVNEFLNLGKNEQEAGDYESAWESYEQALKSAEEGGIFAKLFGSLSSEQVKARKAQEDLAMVWAENIRVPEGKTFSDFVDKLIPVLTRGITDANGVRKADLLAHLGWAYFLKTRDHSIILNETAGLNIEKHYKEALEIDPANPYAHAYWGHLIIWERKDSKEAVKHFAQAVSSHRSLSYVRDIQLAALHNFTYTEMDYLKAVNDMVKNHEKINAEANRNVFTIYYLALNNRTFDEVITAIPPEEQITMFRSLFYNADFDPSKIPTREACLATLQEAAGLKSEALKTWLALRTSLSPHSNYISLANTSIKRLSQH